MTENNSTGDQTLSDVERSWTRIKESYVKDHKESGLLEDKENDIYEGEYEHLEDTKKSSKMIKTSKISKNYVEKIDKFNFENNDNIRKRDKKNIEKHLSCTEHHSNSDISQEDSISFQEQSNQSSDEASIEKVLKDELISEIVELMKIGDRDIPIYPPWIQFRLNNWDPALSKLYEKYKERLMNLFGFDYKLSRIKGSSSTYKLNPRETTTKLVKWAWKYCR